jgi:hypothetical protein
MTSFTIPQNYSAPDGVKEGNEFSEIATFKIKDGKIHIVTIGEDATPVSSKEDKPKGGKAAIKEQLSAMEDKKGSDSMDEETPAEQSAPEEEMD